MPFSFVVVYATSATFHEPSAPFPPCLQLLCCFRQPDFNPPEDAEAALHYKPTPCDVLDVLCAINSEPPQMDAGALPAQPRHSFF